MFLKHTLLLFSVSDGVVSFFNDTYVLDIRGQPGKKSKSIEKVSGVVRLDRMPG